MFGTYLTLKKRFTWWRWRPYPEITDWVAVTKKHGATASFSIGKHEENPEIFKRIITDGHSIGNHTQNHLNGWETSTRTYIENFNSCNLSISNIMQLLLLQNIQTTLWEN
jgi:hypothetical protein